MSSHKDQPPTPRKLREARKRGEVVFSADVASASVFVVGVAALWLLGTTTFGLLRELWLHATSAEMLTRPADRFPELLLHTGRVLLWSALPVMGLAALAGIAGSFFQVGGVAAWNRLVPDVSRLNPTEGLQRMFSTRNLVNLLKMLLKTVLLAALVGLMIRGLLDTALRLGHLLPAGIMATGAKALLQIFGWAAAIYLLVAGIDYAHMHYEFMKTQRMSIDDVRRDHKEVEGDPITRARRRGTYYETVYAGLADRVAMASAVIYSQRTAVALQYLGERDLPRVIARGENDMAIQIRRFAAEALVPMEFDAELAERVHAEVPLEHPIPRSLYPPVAKLLRWAQGAE
jgi:type III secretion protein U